MFAADFPDTVYAIQHMAFEDLGTWEDALYSIGLRVRYVEAGVEDLTRALNHKGLTIILNGPLSVHDQESYPFLKDEMKLLEQRITQGLPTIGIGLGAALIAASLGAQVKSVEKPLIGWSTLQVKDSVSDLLTGLDNNAVLHAQLDEFNLPQGATALADTELSKSSAFSYGKHVLALAFHIEMSSEHIEKWLIGHRFALAQLGLDITSLRHAHQKFIPHLESISPQVLVKFLKQFDSSVV